mgnify:CR=1 FL=1
MQNRELVIKEYFQIYLKLNMSNHKSNQNSNLDFKIEKIEKVKLQFMVVTKAKDTTNKLIICTWARKSNWERTGFSDCPHFETYCQNILNEELARIPGQDLSLLSTLELESFASKIKEELRSLGIPRQF